MLSPTDFGSKPTLTPKRKNYGFQSRCGLAAKNSNIFKKSRAIQGKFQTFKPDRLLIPIFEEYPMAARVTAEKFCFSLARMDQQVFDQTGKLPV
jgi:hypothetical protein